MSEELIDDDLDAAPPVAPAPAFPEPPPAPPPPPWKTKARAAWGGFLRARRAVHRVLDRIDPNDDPDAEPLRVPALVAFSFFVGWALWLYWKWEFQPMQDMGHHVGLSAVAADWGRPGSMYTDLYDPWSLLHANTLFYTFSGYLGRLIGVTRACRVGMSLYVAGVPLANLYALRVFGRSPWAAVATVPLVYLNMNFVGGFANLLFAAPFMVLSVPLLFRAITAPTWGRILAASVAYVLAFLAHAHGFLLAGLLGFAVTACVFAARYAGAYSIPVDAPPTSFAFWRPRLRGAGITAAVATLVVVPSLAFFFRWYQFAFGAGRAAGGVQVTTSGIDKGFGAAYKATDGLFRDFFLYAFRVTIADGDLVLWWKLGAVTTAAMLLARSHKWKRPPFMELAFAIAIFAYFFLPESIDSNPVVGSRQVGIAFWFFAAMVSPVPPRVSRLSRAVVVLGILWWSRSAMGYWEHEVTRFEATEAYGLDWVMEAAPPKLHLHLVKAMPDTSKIFQWKPLWHVDKYYMADGLGQVADNPAIVSTSPIRYRAGVDPHRITYHSHDWPKWKELWDNDELVLVHGWKPTKELLAIANDKAVLLRERGDYQLWRKKGPWMKDAPPAATSGAPSAGK